MLASSKTSRSSPTRPVVGVMVGAGVGAGVGGGVGTTGEDVGRTGGGVFGVAALGRKIPNVRPSTIPTINTEQANKMTQHFFEIAALDEVALDRILSKLEGFTWVAGSSVGDSFCFEFWSSRWSMESFRALSPSDLLTVLLVVIFLLCPFLCDYSDDLDGVAGLWLLVCEGCAGSVLNQVGLDL